MTQRGPRTMARVGAAALLGSAMLLLGVVLLGPPGLLVVSVALAGVALVVVRGSLWSAPRSPAPAADAGDSLRPYPTYRQLDFAVGNGVRSGRLFDRALAPVLVRLATAVLAERRGIDLHRDPLAARGVLGDDVWTRIKPGLDDRLGAGPDAGPAPGARSGRDGADSGARARDVALVLDRLEEL